MLLMIFFSLGLIISVLVGSMRFTSRSGLDWIGRGDWARLRRPYLCWRSAYLYLGIGFFVLFLTRRRRALVISSNSRRVPKIVHRENEAERHRYDRLPCLDYVAT